MCNMLVNVSPGFLSVTCNGRRIGTDGLTITHTHVTLYNRITRPKGLLDPERVFVIYTPQICSVVLDLVFHHVVSY